MPELIFPLAEVLGLAEHAASAPSTAPPAAGEPRGPALLLAAADGIYLLSNGLPQLHATRGEPHAYGIRAVYADGYGPGTSPTVRDTATGVPGELLACDWRYLDPEIPTTTPRLPTADTALAVRGDHADD